MVAKSDRPCWVRLFPRFACAAFLSEVSSQLLEPSCLIVRLASSGGVPSCQTTMCRIFRVRGDAAGMSSPPPPSPPRLRKGEPSDDDCAGDERDNSSGATNGSEAWTSMYRPQYDRLTHRMCSCAHCWMEEVCERTQHCALEHVDASVVSWWAVGEGSHCVRSPDASPESSL